MGAGTPDIKNFYETLGECTDCNFNGKFSRYAEYLSIAMIDDTVFINGTPSTKNVDFVTDNVGQEFFEITLGKGETISIVVRFTYTQFPPQQMPEQKEFMQVFTYSVSNLIAVKRFSNQYSYLFNNDIEFGMGNANYLFYKLESMIADGSSVNYSVAFINIKHVNNLSKYFGSDIAGISIKRFGAKIKTFPNEDNGEFVTHLGGDNFVLVLLTTRLTELETYLSGVPVTLTYGGDKFEHIFKCRAGISTIRPAHRFPNQIMSECSQAYSYSRKNNIDIVYYSEEINVSHHNNTETLTKALNENKFLIYYQPVISVEDKPCLHTAEALARWPLDGKIIAPQDFITLATDSGIVTKIDFYVLEHVCKNIKSWESRGLKSCPITINFSGRHLINTSIADNILEVIDRYGVDHNLIGIEFSEPDFTQRMPMLKNVSHTLNEAGVLVTLDKFSTGQSTLTLLHDIEASYVKIDAGRFDPDDPKGRIIANNMINLANMLGYKVICEGVESQKQADDLVMCGCNLFQSFIYDKPLSERFFVTRLQNPFYEIEGSNIEPEEPVDEASERNNDGAVSGDGAVSVNGGVVSGDGAVSVNGDDVSDDGSVSVNDDAVSDDAIVSGNAAAVSGDAATHVNDAAAYI